MLLFYYLGGEDTPNKHMLMLLVIFGVAALMVSEIRYFSFKEFHIHRRHPFPVLLGLIVVVLLTIGAHQPMLFLGLTRLRALGPGDVARPALGDATAAAAPGRPRRRAAARATRRLDDAGEPRRYPEINDRSRPATA